MGSALSFMGLRYNKWCNIYSIILKQYKLSVNKIGILDPIGSLVFTLLIC